MMSIDRWLLECEDILMMVSGSRELPHASAPLASGPSELSKMSKTTLLQIDLPVTTN